MIIHENDLIRLFADTNSNTSMHAFWVLCKGIVPRLNNKTLVAFPSRQTIADDTGLSVRTVDKALEYLAEKNVIKITKRTNKKTNQNYSNIYTIDTELLKTVGNLKSKTEDTIDNVKSNITENQAIPPTHHIDTVVYDTHLVGEPCAPSRCRRVHSNLQDTNNLQVNITSSPISKELKKIDNVDNYIELIKEQSLHQSTDYELITRNLSREKIIAIIYESIEFHSKFRPAAILCRLISENEIQKKKLKPKTLANNQTPTAKPKIETYYEDPVPGQAWQKAITKEQWLINQANKPISDVFDNPNIT